MQLTTGGIIIRLLASVLCIPIFVFLGSGPVFGRTDSWWTRKAVWTRVIIGFLIMLGADLHLIFNYNLIWFLIPFTLAGITYVLVEAIIWSRKN